MYPARRWCSAAGPWTLLGDRGVSVILYWLFGGWWAISAAIQLTSLVVPARRPTPALGKDTQGVSVLVPVKGVDFELPANIEAFFRQSYPRLELIFAVADANDRAIPAIEAAIADHPTVDARLVIGGEEMARNPKVANLMSAERWARYDLLLLSAANMAPAHDTIVRLISLLKSDIGVISSIPIAVRPTNFVGEIECATNNGYGARWLYTAQRLGTQATNGAATLVRRDSLRRGGGLAALAHSPCDDCELTLMMGKLGLRAILAPEPILHPIGARTFREFWQRHRRWIHCRRHCLSWAVLVECLLLNSIAPAIVGAMFWSNLLGASPVVVGSTLLASFLLVEALFHVRMGWKLSWQAPAAWLARDVLLLLLWLDELVLRRRLVWRGTVIEVSKPTAPSTH